MSYLGFLYDVFFYCQNESLLLKLLFHSRPELDSSGDEIRIFSWSFPVRRPFSVKQKENRKYEKEKHYTTVKL